MYIKKTFSSDFLASFVYIYCLRECATVLKYISISITSHNTTCPTELERHCVTLRFSFGMLHRALELNLFVQHQNTEVCLQQLPYGTASAAPQN